MSNTHEHAAELEHHDGHGHDHEHAEVHGPVAFAVPGGLKKGALGLIVAGAVLLGAGFATAGEHPTWRLWSNLLIASMFFALLAVGAGFIVAIMHVTKAGWGVVTRRVPEAMTTYLPVALLTMLVVGGLGMHDLYEWSHPDIVAEDHLLRHKSAMLNPTWYLGSVAVIIGGWSLLTTLLRKNSVAQDSDGDVKHTGKNILTSVLFLIFFGLSITIGSLIWLMSIEPHWFSTMFGVYQFSGAHKAAAAAGTLFLIYLSKNGHLKQVNPSHIHDWGKMMFAFSTFWAYIWVSQFLLIWYANIPEETGYFLLRQEPGWIALFALNVILNWVIPFFTLLPRPNKRNPAVLVPVAIVVLLGFWLDLYLQVMPGTSHFTAEHHKLEHLHGPFFGPMEFGAMALLGGVFLLVVPAMMAKVSLVPVKDPYLQESLHHQQ
ncbi:MAG: hypothetical protein HY902_01025 [Deltaproteobacteria bacterium]|nr:hypothetical protein [Deltaproteobacteria bacterium]